MKIHPALILALATLRALAADQAAASPVATPAPTASSTSANTTTPPVALTAVPQPETPNPKPETPSPPAQPSNRPDPTMSLPPTITPGTQVEKLAGDFAFTEGTTCAPNGDVFFIDQPNDRIMHWDVANKKLSVFLHPSGYSNGMCFDLQGNLISCADEKNQLWSITPDGNHTVLVTDYQGKLMNGPNDVFVLANGGMYMTDPFYRRTWWNPPHDQLQPVRGVYYLSPDHKKLTLVDGDYKMPNGISGTPDGKILYVSDINGGPTWGYDIQPDGSLANRRAVCPFGSDGMTLDNQGNLYMSVGVRGARGVTVVSTKTGKQIGFIAMPEAPANMAFAGPDRQTLYICARTGFYCIRTNVKGANPAK
jgi:gluconolactonase